jgi:hypothetical protein
MDLLQPLDLRFSAQSDISGPDQVEHQSGINGISGSGSMISGNGFRALEPETKYKVYGLQVGPDQSIERGHFRVLNPIQSSEIPLNGMLQQ